MVIFMRKHRCVHRLTSATAPSISIRIFSLFDFFFSSLISFRAGVMLERHMRNVSIFIAGHARSILSFIYVAVFARRSHTFSNHNCLSAHFHGRFGTSAWTNTNGYIVYWKWCSWQFDQFDIFAVQTRGKQKKNNKKKSIPSFVRVLVLICNVNSSFTVY